MRLWLFRLLYALAWALLWPFALVYLHRRSRRDAGYALRMGERLGRYPQALPGAVWVHAVSLGEFRSAVPIIRALLDRGEQVVVTTMTPAGRREAERVLAPDVAAGLAAVVWVPIETRFAWRGFLRAFRPRLGLVMEVEIWPRMILATRAAGVPLYLCNAQYPRRSFDRDQSKRRWRGELIALCAGGLVKSDLQAARFQTSGLSPVIVTGETRFDQPVPAPLVAAGRAAREALAPDARVVAIASAVEGEDEIYTSAIKALRDVLAARRDHLLVIYIPRRPERFDEVHATLTAAGLRVARRSAVLAPDFGIAAQAAEMDVLLGDSLGEMYGYLAMADRVVVGGGFTPAGAHNIIEPLALGKPVLTGPVTWPIEYPFEEAQAAGVARSVADAQALAATLAGPDWTTPQAIAGFFADHSGAAARTLAALDTITRR